MAKPRQKAPSRQQLRHVLEQANCLVWQGKVRETFDNSQGQKFFFDSERATYLHWEIAVVNQSESEVPSWLPVARQQGQTITDAWLQSREPEDELTAGNVAYDALRTGKKRYTQTFRNRMADGSIRWVHEDVRVELLPSLQNPREHGMLPGGNDKDRYTLRRWCLTGVVTDITERKKVEVEHAYMMESANCLLWHATVRENGNPDSLDWEVHSPNNELAQRFLPLHLETGQTYAEAFYLARPQEDRHRWDVAGDAHIRAGRNYTQEFRVKAADGSVRWLHEAIHVETMEPEKTWRVVAVCVDITERKLADISREAAVAALETAQANMRRVVEGANCLLWQGEVTEAFTPPGPHHYVFDAERYTFATWDLQVLNEAEVLRWLSIDCKENEPFVNAWIRVRHPGDKLECDQISRDALLSNADRYTHIFRTFVQDGSVRWLQEDVRVEALAPPEDSILNHSPLRRWRLTGVVTDVTERKQAEERQRALAEDLKRTNDALQEFAYVASHDLKEPLRKIQSFGNILKRRAGDTLSEESAIYVDRMTDAASRMQALVEALLQYSRAAGKAIVVEQVDLNEIAARVLCDLEARIASVNGVIEIAPLPTIFADALQMQQLFQNLLANAMKFRRSDIVPLICVTAEEGVDQVTLRFVDNGIGFDPCYSERIFQVFERLEGRGNSEGSGVGLSICKKIVERHGGTIVAEGRMGEGATFCVTLPTATPLVSSCAVMP